MGKIKMLMKASILITLIKILIFFMKYIKNIILIIKLINLCIKISVNYKSTYPGVNNGAESYIKPDKLASKTWLYLTCKQFRSY
jgi:hypothetical protein